MSDDSILAYKNCLVDLENYQYNLTHNLDINFDQDVTSIAECINPLVLSGLAFSNLIVLFWLLIKFKQGRKFKDKIKNIKFWIYAVSICLDICK